jgi:hypothetical protein
VPPFAAPTLANRSREVFLPPLWPQAIDSIVPECRSQSR